MTTTILPGSTFECTSSKGRGAPVKVTRVTDTGVQFQNLGRGEDKSKKFILPIPAFLAKYSPSHAPEKPRPAPTTRPMPRIRTLTIPPVEIEQREELMQAIATATPKTRNGHPYNLPHPPSVTDEQAREIYLLVKGGASYQEAADAYSVNVQTVGRIARRETYKHVTQGLDAPTTQEEQPMVNGHQENAWLDLSLPAVIEADRAQPKVDSTGRSTPSPLVAELADALELLVTYVGKPLPKYLSFNIGEVRDLIERARH